MLNTHWKDWCCSWSSKTLDMWWKELPHFKRLWCWERLRAKKRRRQQRRRWLDSITVDGHEFEQTAGDCEEQKDQCAAVNGLTVKREQHLREKSWQSGKQATLMLTDFNSCISLHKITWIFKDYGRQWIIFDTEGKAILLVTRPALVGLKRSWIFLRQWHLH